MLDCDSRHMKVIDALLSDKGQCAAPREMVWHLMRVPERGDRHQVDLCRDHLGFEPRAKDVMVIKGIGRAIW
jgi:hypothetical protein